MRTITVFLLSLALAACATPYQTKGYRGGYSVTPLTDNRAEVSFNGNTFTSGTFVRRAALRAAAEYAMQRGYHWLAVVGDHLTVNTRTTFTPPAYATDGYVAGYPATASGYSRPASVNEHARHKAVLEIVMGQGTVPIGAYPADEVAKNLRDAME